MTALSLLIKQRDGINKAIEALKSIDAATPAPPSPTANAKNKLTPLARKKMSNAAKARWAAKQATALPGTAQVTNSAAEPAAARARGKGKPVEKALTAGG